MCFCLKCIRINEEKLKFGKNPENYEALTLKDVVEVEEMFSSEENIPASQEPIHATVRRTQSLIKSFQRLPNTYFELALMKSGVQFDEGQHFVLACDHISFVNKLRILLNRNQYFHENLNMFITGLRDAWSKYALKLLSGCTISIPGDEKAYQSQDSVIANFFMIDFLRDKVLDLLLEQVKKSAFERTPASRIAGNTIPLLPLMLSHLQYVSSTHNEMIYILIKEIFENDLKQSKWDIIASAELILDPSKHDEFAKLLIDCMANSNELFKPLTIQTLTNLSLSPQMQGKLHGKILAYIKEDQCPKSIIPLLIKFMLKILSEDNEETIKQLISTLRGILQWREQPSTGTLAKDTQLQLELFSYIDQGLTRSRKFYLLWQKTIASLVSEKFKSIDFVIALLLMHIRDDNSFYLENVLRRHVKILSSSIVQDVYDSYAPILEQHWHILMQIINLFLQEKNKAVVEFARTCCGTFFEISESVQKSILRNLLGLTCEKSNQNTRSSALNMIRDLWLLYPKYLHNWGMLLFNDDITSTTAADSIKTLCFDQMSSSPNCVADKSEINMMDATTNNFSPLIAPHGANSISNQTGCMIKSSNSPDSSIVTTSNTRTTITKKRRGRPPKTHGDIPDRRQTQHLSESEPEKMLERTKNNEANGNSPLKYKKRDNALVDSTSIVTTSNTSTTTKKRGRGRPAKTYNNVPDGRQICQFAESKQREVLECGEDKVSCKSRLKHKERDNGFMHTASNSPASSIATSSNTTTTTTVKRGRGRPAKTKSDVSDGTQTHHFRENKQRKVLERGENKASRKSRVRHKARDNGFMNTSSNSAASSITTSSKTSTTTKKRGRGRPAKTHSDMPERSQIQYLSESEQREIIERGKNNESSRKSRLKHKEGDIALEREETELKARNGELKKEWKKWKKIENKLKGAMKCQYY